MGKAPTAQEEARISERAWPPPQGQWTYEDWLRLPDDGYRYEVIDGVLYMAPPPSTLHQRIAARLVEALTAFLRDDPPPLKGEVLFAPTGVRLPSQPVPFQPDILFIRAERLKILGEQYVEGAPDLIIEILPPGNWLYDRREKMRAYQEGRVAEYWIVDPDARTIEVYVLEGEAYRLAGRYGLGKIVRSQVVTGFRVPVAQVFPSALERVE